MATLWPLSGCWLAFSAQDEAREAAGLGALGNPPGQRPTDANETDRRVKDFSAFEVHLLSCTSIFQALPQGRQQAKSGTGLF